MLVRAGLARAHGQVVSDPPKGKEMAQYVSMEKQAKAGKMGLYGGNKPKAENTSSRLPSRLPIRSQPVEVPSSSEENILSEPVIQPISIGDFQ
jgi:hypothetical protein